MAVAARVVGGAAGLICFGTSRDQRISYEGDPRRPDDHHRPDYNLEDTHGLLPKIPGLQSAGIRAIAKPKLIVRRNLKDLNSGKAGNLIRLIKSAIMACRLAPAHRNAPMHTRSKRYRRRQRARRRRAALDATREASQMNENRLALRVAKCLRKVKRAPIETSKDSPA